MEYVVFAVLILVLFIVWAMSRRAKARSAADDQRLRREITVGTQVMTTSGLYGSVVALNSDDTVILAIAPGVEVRWAFAALRDAAALPPRYRRPTGAEPSATGASSIEGNAKSG
jgi:preprotein translocase subunit YajC